MYQNVETFSNIMNKFDAELNLFIPANTIEKNGKYFTRIKFNNICYGAHGYSHLDYSTLEKEVQEDHFKKIIKIFNNEGIKEFGFRAPYGRLNGNTINLLKRFNFQFDCSNVYIYNEIIKYNQEVEYVLRDYTILEKPDPIIEQNIMRIPFSLPDDEILVDRLNYNENTVEKIWCKMIDEIDNNGNLLILQLHPHRIRILKNALKKVVKTAINSNVHINTLNELKKLFNNSYKKFKSEKRMCITGDIDALRITEFV